MKNVTIPLIVHPVKTLTVSLPKAFSTAPPPRDDPIPAFADGFCMSITKITKTLVQTSKNVSSDEKNEAINKKGANLNLTDKKNTSIRRDITNRWVKYHFSVCKRAY
jgi:hypothetical protein